MHVLKVIPYRLWVRDDGRTASIYGACPWASAAEEQRWRMEQRGWTLYWDDNTVGHHREEFVSREEAVEYARRVNEERIEGYRQHVKWYPEQEEKVERLIKKVPLEFREEVSA